MAEYIEREAICEKCENKNSCYPFPEMRKKCPVYKASAADVVEVRHGHWISYLDGDHIMPERYYQCSECGSRGYTRLYPYCNCGAKMDGGNK